MAPWSDPAAQRWLIGVQLQHFRKRAGWTAAAAAKAIGCTPGKVNHLESGRNRQQPGEIITLLRKYGADSEAIDRMTTLAEQPDERAWWSPWEDMIAPWLALFVGLEGQASEEFLFEPLVIPGILQTESYARRISEASLRVRGDHVERVVSLRRARNALLEQDEPLSVQVVIGEGALNLDIGDTNVLAEQYAYLLELAGRPNVQIQVLRPCDGLHSGVTGSFMLLNFAHAHPVVYVESQDDAMYVHDEDRVRGYIAGANDMRKVALCPQRSIEMIRELANELLKQKA